MENRLYYWKLACYETSGNLPKRAIGKSNFIDLSLLPKETMREEYRRYFLYRGGQVSLNTIDILPSGVQSPSTAKKHT